MTAYVPGTEERDLKNLIRSLQQIAAGRSNATGVVTLTPDAALTLVNDDNVSIESVITLNALTDSAWAEMSSIRPVNIRNRSFALQHESSGVTDRIFRYAIQG